MAQPSERHNHITIQALRKTTRNLISAYLNPEVFQLTESGRPCYWLGLVQLCGISTEYVSSIEANSDPTSKLLQLWNENDPDSSTIDKLLTFVGEIDRYDVIDDASSLIEEDVRIFHEQPFTPRPLNASQIDEENILTNDDVARINEGLDPQHYDAFVLFHDDDIDFATKLIDTMEQQYQLKFCVKDRDVVCYGLLQNSAIIKLITERCEKLVVIISDEFVKSSANTFLLRFAQSFGIEQRQRKIVPCVYKHVENWPAELTGVFILDYRGSNQWWSFWEILRNTLCPKKAVARPRVKVADEAGLNRSKSDNQRHSALYESELATPRPLNHVKFNSTGNINASEGESIMADSPLIGNNSANSVEILSENGKKKKTSWIKRLISKSHSKNDSKEKKQIFKTSKRKVALAN